MEEGRIENARPEDFTAGKALVCAQTRNLPGHGTKN